MIEKFYGPKNYGPRKATYGIIFHTTESAGVTVASAKSTATWQARSSTGSYNYIVGIDGTIETVPIGDAAGGVNPFSPAFKPKANVLRYKDPNSQFVQVAFEGKTARLDPNWPESMIEQAVDIVLMVERKYGIDAHLVRHADFQTNRSDPGVNLINAVLEAYEQRTQKPITYPEPPLAGKVDARGGKFPNYVDTYEDGFKWYHRQILRLMEKE